MPHPTLIQLDPDLVDVLEQLRDIDDAGNRMAPASAAGKLVAIRNLINETLADIEAALEAAKIDRAVEDEQEREP